MFALCGKGKNVWKLLTGSTEMETLVGLFVMLLGVSHGVETNCDARQNGTQCYGALGGTVALRLMDSASEIVRYRWFNKAKNTTFGWANNKITFNSVSDRSSFTPSNGIFRLSELSRTDGGEYTLETFDSGGEPLKVLTLQLTIQAPVSSVLLVPECLSQGQMKVTCSSEGGDSPQFSWTLDGRTLTDNDLLSGNTETNSITLKQKTSGQLVCSVRNRVSSVSNQTHISDCGFIFIECISVNGTEISEWVFEANNTLQCIEPTTTPASIAGKETTVSINTCTNITSSTLHPSMDPWHIRNLPIMAGILSSLVLLLLVGVAVVCTHKKRSNNKPKEEDDQELTYADVQVMQRPGRQIQQREETVEYGQIKFSQPPRHNVQPADECVYAKVRRA